MSLISTACEAGLILLLGPLVELMVGSGSPSLLFGPLLNPFLPPEMPAVQRLVWLGVGIFLISMIKSLHGYGYSLLTARWWVRWHANIQRLLLRRYLSFGKLYFDKTHTGSIQTVLGGFVGAVPRGFGVLQAALNSLVYLALYFSILFYLSWQLTLVTIFVFPLLNFIGKAVTRRVGLFAERRAGIQLRLGELMAEILRGIPLIKLNHCEDREFKRYSELADYLMRTDLKIHSRGALLVPLQETVVQFFYLLLVITMGILIHTHQAAAGVEALIFILVLRRIMGNTGSLIGVRSYLLESASAFSRVEEVLSDIDKSYVRGGRAKLKGLERSLEVHRLSFSYYEGSPVLNEVSFEIRKNERLALVGPSGAGKSTLVHLLLRYYPVERGRVFLDGKDINEFEIESLLDHFSFVSQDPTLFNATLRDNLTYGLWRPFSEEQLWRVLEDVSLREMARELPRRMDTLIGERGVRLSGGERQRLALARALLKGAEFLVLDEATNALDVHTERAVQQAIARTMENRTSIVIAHRLHTVRNADRIVVLESGRVHETGTFSECLRRRGLFYEMYRAQSFA